ncbi:MAG: aldehyde dehydrogenase [Prevotellaceae bacterium]|nr:aldehyde dehydrogenase [Prevotellaceae bacterium]
MYFNRPALISHFSELGKRIHAWLRDETTCPALSAAVQKSMTENSWFTAGNIRYALAAIASDMLDAQRLQDWLAAYPVAKSRKQAGVIMAGNIPLVGFHDFLCVLASGHSFTGKLSHRDAFLLPALASILTGIHPGWRSRIAFSETLPVRGMDFFIATGSDTSAHYFETIAAAMHASGGGRSLIRRNRRSVAVLSGDETEEELNGLANDLFGYFGWGCRNVSLLYVPEGYCWQPLAAVLSAQQTLLQHTGYANNYRYQKALLSLQGKPFHDVSVALLCEDASLHAPPAVVHYRYYTAIGDALKSIEQQRGQIQCVVSRAMNCDNFCTFGHAQRPSLHDYADGVDTMKWMTGWAMS